MNLILEFVNGIIVKRKVFDTLINQYKWLNFPIIRGAICLFESMKMGFSTLQWSAEIAFPEENKKQNKFIDLFMIIISIIFAISLFIYLPLGVTKWMGISEQAPFYYNIIAGFIRITIFKKKIACM